MISGICSLKHMPTGDNDLCTVLFAGAKWTVWSLGYVHWSTCQLDTMISALSYACQLDSLISGPWKPSVTRSFCTKLPWIWIMWHTTPTAIRSCQVIRKMDDHFGISSDGTSALLSHQLDIEKQLDIQILYLRRVHHFCFYSGKWCKDNDFASSSMGRMLCVNLYFLYCW